MRGIYDYSKLKGRIKEKGKTQTEVAHSIPLDPTTLSLELCGKGEFRQSEICAICNCLEIPPEEIPRYFFAS